VTCSMRIALAVTLGLIQGGWAFTSPVAMHAARPPVRANAPVMIAGGGLKGGRSFISRLVRSGSRSGGAHDGGAAGGGGRSGPGGVSRGAGEGEASDGSSPTAAVWAGYLALLESKPVVTKALTSLLGFAIGDVLAQCCIEKKECFDWLRLLRFSTAGMLIHGPAGHWFYGNLDSLIPGATARKVATKVFVDQIVYAPIFGTLFFSYMAATEGKGPVMVAKRVKHELMTQVAASWKVWPLAHAINFALVPTSQRILYINSIQIGYNMFLSVLGSRGA